MMKWAIDCFIVRCSDILLTINFANKIKTMLNKKALQFGLILGGIIIILSLLIYFMGVEIMTNWWLGIGFGLLILGLYIFFSLSLKKTSSLEKISYWQAFFAIMIMSVIAGVMNSGYQRTINYLDPHLMENIENATIQKTTAWMEKFKAPQDKIDQTIDDMQAKFEAAKNITIVGMIKDIFFTLLWYSVFGFIMAIFVRKTPPLFPESGVQQPAQNS